MNLEQYHLDSSPSVVMIQCVEISHSLWPQSLRYVLNHGDGVTVTHENGETADYQYMPLDIRRGVTTDNIDQSLQITVADLGAEVPKLLKLLRESDTNECPQVIYRNYLSTNLNEPIEVISKLYIEKTNRDEQGSTFEANAKRANSVGTGRRYTFEDFPSLRAFVV